MHCIAMRKQSHCLRGFISFGRLMSKVGSNVTHWSSSDIYTDQIKQIGWYFFSFCLFLFLYNILVLYTQIAQVFVSAGHLGEHVSSLYSRLQLFFHGEGLQYSYLSRREHSRSSLFLISRMNHLVCSSQLFNNLSCSQFRYEQH